MHTPIQTTGRQAPCRAAHQESVAVPWVKGETGRSFDIGCEYLNVGWMSVFVRDGNGWMRCISSSLNSWLLSLCVGLRCVNFEFHG